MSDRVTALWSAAQRASLALLVILIAVPCRAAQESNKPLNPIRDPGATSAQSETLETLAVELLQACFEMPEKNFLLDPQHLIRDPQAENLRRQLTAHAEDMRTAIYLLAIGPQQTLPPKASLAQIASGALSRRPSCLVIYPVGQPQRARLFFSGEVIKVTPQGYLNTLMHDCINEAQQADDAVQIEHFVKQLSLRLLWLERAYPLDESAVADKINTTDGALIEIGATSQNSAPAFWDFSRWKSAIIKITGSFIALASLCLLIRRLMRWHRRRQSHRVWILPEVEPVQRLGGPHCGGSGVMVKYG